jgi:hypothetical protein
MSAAEFEDYTTGQTLTFSFMGVPYGVEQYLPGRRVIWAFIGEDCHEGRWYEDAGNICFVYDHARSSRNAGASGAPRTGCARSSPARARRPSSTRSNARAGRSSARAPTSASERRAAHLRFRAGRDLLSRAQRATRAWSEAWRRHNRVSGSSIIVEGGHRLTGSDRALGQQERGAADRRGGAADRPDGASDQRAAHPRCRGAGRTDPVGRRRGALAVAQHAGDHRARPAAGRSRPRSVRAHPRLDPAGRPDAGALRRAGPAAAGRRRDRPAAGGHAFPGAQAAGRRDQA